jgi:hypothetical protein
MVQQEKDVDLEVIPTFIMSCFQLSVSIIIPCVVLFLINGGELRMEKRNSIGDHGSEFLLQRLLESLVSEIWWLLIRQCWVDNEWDAELSIRSLRRMWLSKFNKFQSASLEVMTLHYGRGLALVTIPSARHTIWPGRGGWLLTVAYPDRVHHWWSRIIPGFGRSFGKARHLGRWRLRYAHNCLPSSQQL